MKETEHTIHKAELKNNCPECYSTDGLVLSFIQKERENSWYRKVEKDIKGVIFCTNCKTQIFPVRWDEHIERVYQYYEKLVKPKPARTHFKMRLWLVLTISIIILTGGLFWVGYNLITV